MAKVNLSRIAAARSLLGDDVFFPLDTLATGTNYVDESWKSAENLFCQQLRVILIHRLLEACYVQWVMYDDAFTFSDLRGARGKGRNSDGGVRIANFVRSCLP